MVMLHMDRMASQLTLGDQILGMAGVVPPVDADHREDAAKSSLQRTTT